MATTYLSPGVYIEEIDKGTKPIQGVPTSVTAFVGFTEKAEAVEGDGYTTRSVLSQPRLITNWGQYQTQFGGLVEDAYLPYAVRGFFDNGGSICHVISVRTLGDPHPAQALVYAPDRRRKDRDGAPALLIHAKQRDMDGNRINGNQVKIKISLEEENKPAAKPAPEPNGKKPDSGTEAPSMAARVDDTATTTEKVEGDPKQPPRPQPPPAKGGSGIPPQGVATETNGTPAQPKLRFEVYIGDNQKPVDSQTVDLSELPFWGERARESDGAHDRFKHIKVWTLNKTGKLEERMPRFGSYPLDGAMAQIDLDLLGQSDVAKLTGPSEDKLDEVFKDNSQSLFEGNSARRKGIGALEAVDNVNLICAPDLMLAHERGWITDDQLRGIQQAILDHCRRTHYRFAILDAPYNKRTAEEILDWRMNVAGYDSMHGALYFPWVKIADPVTGRSRLVPPSGYLAGIYARSDDQRGVHKAPANEVVAGVIDVAINVTKGEQDLLNPQGINCIRKFPGRGIRVWGARTLSSDPSWRYINVRRLFNYVEESVELSTQWIVFEPNDFVLWSKVRRDISAFLRTVWLSGALFGRTPEESFYVKCDEETNLPELRDLGQMICEIGMSPVKPAEFVIFRFSQWSQGSEA